MNYQAKNMELHHRRRNENYDQFPRNVQHENRERGHQRPPSFEHQQETQIDYIPVPKEDGNYEHSKLDKVTKIVQHMEQDDALMQDNPIAEQLRKDTLRDMPQCLTLKRYVKAKLTKSVSKKSKHRPLGLFKQCQYRMSMAFAKYQMAIRDIFYSFELWYSALKSIEGYFGSGVASYFKFLRLMFITNLLTCIPIIGFLVAPQLVHSIHNDETGILNYTTCNGNITNTTIRDLPFDTNNIITGEGYFTRSTLYYGFYTNKSINSFSNLFYSMPHAYLFTMLSLYAITFIYFSVRMARSYKHSFIETSGGLKNVFANKIFCGWDYSIATEDGAKLKSTTIYNELKELLSMANEDLSKLPFKRKFWTFGIQLVCHIIILVILCVTAFGLITQFNNYDLHDIEATSLGNRAVINSIIITLIMNLGPLVFSWIIRFEDYKNPKTALYISLTRTFLLEIVVIGALLYFWLIKSDKNGHCWETLFGQEIYRLVLIDFLFSLLFVLFNEVFRKLIFKYFWPKIGEPEFDISRHTLQIIYNQTLFWLGLYFSPLLAVMITIKFWITWYIKQFGCIYFCRPAKKSWRAAQTQTLFLVMTFFALFLVIICIGYSITQVHSSKICGPFRDYCQIYEIFAIQGDFIAFLIFLTKPGVITGLLIAMGVWVYYLREKSIAHKEMVELLQEMLVTEAKDKEFLLSKISQVTEGKWMYNLKRTFERSKLLTEPSRTWRYKPELSGEHSQTNLQAPKTQEPNISFHARHEDHIYQEPIYPEQEPYDHLRHSPEIRYERQTSDFPYEDYEDHNNKHRQEFENRRQYQHSSTIKGYYEEENNILFQKYRQSSPDPRANLLWDNYDKFSQKSDMSSQSFEQKNYLYHNTQDNRQSTGNTNFEPRQLPQREIENQRNVLWNKNLPKGFSEYQKTNVEPYPTNIINQNNNIQKTSSKYELSTARQDRTYNQPDSENVFFSNNLNVNRPVARRNRDLDQSNSVPQSRNEPEPDY